jgi:HEAT repeat protein
VSMPPTPPQDDPETRRQAAAALRDLDPEHAAPSLLQALGDEDWRVRKEAVLAAAALSPAPAVLKALVTALGPSDNVGLRNAVVEALSAFGPDAVDALAAALASLDADGRKLAAEALARTTQSTAVPVLRGLLRDPDANVAVAAVEALTALGAARAEEVEVILRSCLDAQNGFVRLAALDGLGRLGVALPWDRLERLRTDELVAPAMLSSMGRSGDERAAPFIVDALSRARGGTMLEALRAVVELARSGNNQVLALQRAASSLGPEIEAQLVSLVTGESDGDARVTAILALGALGVRSAPVRCAEALDEEELEGAAEEALDWLGPAAVRPLLEHGMHSEPHQRAAALELAARLSDASNSELVRAEALAALSHPAPEMVRAALGALAVVGDGTTLPAVAATLARVTMPSLRRAAESALAVLAARFAEPARVLAQSAEPGSAETAVAAVVIRVLGPPVRGNLAADVEFLAAALTSPTPDVRRAALEALGAVGGALALEPLSLAIYDEERSVRLTAVRALGRLRSAEGEVLGLPQLIALAEGSANEEVALAALLALGETADNRALPILRPLVRGGDPKAAVAAIEALGAFPESRRFESLIDGLSHSAMEVVKAALRALGECSDARVLLHFGVALDHEAWDVRRLAADLLGRCGGAAAAPLRARLAVEEDPLVQEAIGRALERMAGVRRSLSPTRGSYFPK